MPFLRRPRVGGAVIHKDYRNGRAPVLVPNMTPDPLAPHNPWGEETAQETLDRRMAVIKPRVLGEDHHKERIARLLATSHIDDYALSHLPLIAAREPTLEHRAAQASGMAYAAGVFTVNRFTGRHKIRVYMPADEQEHEKEENDRRLQGTLVHEIAHHMDRLHMIGSHDPVGDSPSRYVRKNFTPQFTPHFEGFATGVEEAHRLSMSGMPNRFQLLQGVNAYTDPLYWTARAARMGGGQSGGADWQEFQHSRGHGATLGTRPPGFWSKTSPNSATLPLAVRTGGGGEQTRPAGTGGGHLGLVSGEDAIPTSEIPAVSHSDTPTAEIPSVGPRHETPYAQLIQGKASPSMGGLGLGRRSRR